MGKFDCKILLIDNQLLKMKLKSKILTKYFTNHKEYVNLFN